MKKVSKNIMKALNEVCGDEKPFVRSIQKEGFNFLSSGAYQEVYRNDKFPYIFKVNKANNSDHAALKWLQWCMINKGLYSYIPKIELVKTFVSKEGKIGFIAISEKLLEVPYDSTDKTISVESKNILKKVGHKANMPFLRAGYPELLNIYKSDFRKFSFCDIGAHHNMMMRKNGELVVNDPFCPRGY